MGANNIRVVDGSRDVKRCGETNAKIMVRNILIALDKLITRIDGILGLDVIDHREELQLLKARK